VTCDCLKESQDKRWADGIDPDEAEQDKPDRRDEYPKCREEGNGMD